MEVSCLPGFDGGLPQTFVLEVKTNRPGRLSYNLTSKLEPYFFLDNLEAGITFKFVIYAVNAKGRSSGVLLEEVTFTDPEKQTGKQRK